MEQQVNNIFSTTSWWIVTVDHMKINRGHLLSKGIHYNKFSSEGVTIYWSDNIFS